MIAHFILYVSNQERSMRFYAYLLGCEPKLHVPGMTEFSLPSGDILGLMPEASIKRLLGDGIPDPSKASGIPRAELYLLTENPFAMHKRALVSGAVELSPLQLRTWGHYASYCLDPDGHVLAFASESSPNGEP